MAMHAFSAALSPEERDRLRRTRFGVIGGGQLSLMLAEAARALGVCSFTIVDPTPHCPAHEVASEHLIGAFDDGLQIALLADHADIVTIEIELAGEGPLRQLQRQGIAVHPSPDTLATIKDKLRQKQFLSEGGVPTAPFREVSTAQDIESALREFGSPVILKQRTGGYDGRGNYVLHSAAQIESAYARLGIDGLYVEGHVPFVKELAVMVARNVSGQVVAYPTVETQHVRNICDLVIAPAPVPAGQSAEAQRVAKDAVARFGSAGIFGVEMFLLEDGRVLVNEIAPRTHNSGHYTIEACEVSQFEQHLRAIADLPLGGTELDTPAVMINVLGERDGPALIGRETREIDPGAVLHVYGKTSTAVDRKMGHITLIGEDTDALITRARAIRKTVVI